MYTREIRRKRFLRLTIQWRHINFTLTLRCLDSVWGNDYCLTPCSGKHPAPLHHCKQNPLIGTVKWKLIPSHVSIVSSSCLKGNRSSHHYDDVIMDAIASQITSLTIVFLTVYSGADQSKHQSSASLAFVWGIYRGPVNSPHKWPVTRKMFPFDDVIMTVHKCLSLPRSRIMRPTQYFSSWTAQCRSAKSTQWPSRAQSKPKKCWKVRLTRYERWIWCFL